MMKFRNFSAKSGSRLASFARRRRRSIWYSSRAGSAGGSSCVAFSTPTALVQRKRSASIRTRAASILSIECRYRPRRCLTFGSIVMRRSSLLPRQAGQARTAAAETGQAKTAAAAEARQAARLDTGGFRLLAERLELLGVHAG